MLQIPEKIEYVLKKLHQNGYEAYIVGGCVRDALLGITPHDYDVTTSAKPEEVIEIFDRTVPTGIKHGTVTVIIEKEPVEVTTFRTEGDYSDSRRPDKVEFVTSLKEDLSRRDFTVNALAYNTNSGLKDYFSGLKDLKNKVLRAVGDPTKRFSEDALRILRLFRFASQLGFSMEEKTYEAALDLCDNLENISRERIFIELLKTITGENPRVVSPLLQNGALAFLGFSKTMDFSGLAPLKENPNLCLAVFLYNTCRRPLDTLKALKCSNAQYRYCNNFLKLSKLSLPQNGKDIKNALFLTEPEAVSHWLLYLKATGENTDNAEKLLEKTLEYKEPYLISHLKISGADLQNAGLSGKAVGETLEKLRKEVLNNPMLNTKAQLIKLAREFYNE